MLLEHFVLLIKFGVIRNIVLLEIFVLLTKLLEIFCVISGFIVFLVILLLSVLFAYKTKDHKRPQDI